MTTQLKIITVTIPLVYSLEPRELDVIDLSAVYIEKAVCTGLSETAPQCCIASARIIGTTVNPTKYTMASTSTPSNGAKPADPYKAANEELDVPPKQKMEDLSKFMSVCKFGMMTPRTPDSGNLVYR